MNNIVKFLKLLGGGGSSIPHKIKWFFANRNNETKLRYLRELGCKVGDKTRFVGKLDKIGSEPYLIEIGEDCLISDNVYFHTHDGGVKVLNTLGYWGKETCDRMARIKVGNNCFIGSGARIMMGVIIGDNCIIGANSVVTKSIPSGSVVAGMPAKVICSIDEYFKKNTERGYFYITTAMKADEKKAFLLKNIQDLN